MRFLHVFSQNTWFSNNRVNTQKIQIFERKFTILPKFFTKNQIFPLHLLYFFMRNRLALVLKCDKPKPLEIQKYSKNRHIFGLFWYFVPFLDFLSRLVKSWKDKSCRPWILASFLLFTFFDFMLRIWVFGCFSFKKFEFSVYWHDCLNPLKHGFKPSRTCFEILK